MLSRIQKTITLCLLLLIGVWLWFFWSASPRLALLGIAAPLAIYAGFLGLEFVMLWFVNRAGPAPRPEVQELLGAWMGEVLAAPRVFFYWQPFCHQSIPDPLSGHPGRAGQRGVVFVHGFFCNRAFWTPWLRRLRDEKRVFSAVSLEPVFGSIDDYTAQIDQAVLQVTTVTGLPPLVVCHSMGGLAVRAWMKAMKSEARVYHVVTIGTPHRGTWLARFGRSLNGRQMRLDADWHQQLDHDMPQDLYTRFTCWYSRCDNIVFPGVNATLPGADNRLLAGAAHVQMAFLPEVMTGTLDLLEPLAI